MPRWRLSSWLQLFHGSLVQTVAQPSHITCHVTPPSFDSSTETYSSRHVLPPPPPPLPPGVLAYLPRKQNAGARTGFHGRTRTLLAKTSVVSRILQGLVTPLLTPATPSCNSGAR